MKVVVALFVEVVVPVLLKVVVLVVDVFVVVVPVFIVEDFTAVELVYAADVVVGGPGLPIIKPRPFSS